MENDDNDDERRVLYTKYFIPVLFKLFLNVNRIDVCMFLNKYLLIKFIIIIVKLCLNF